VAEPRSAPTARVTAGDRQPALAAILAAAAVAGLGLICKLALVDPLMERLLAPPELRGDVDVLLLLTFSVAALLAAGSALLFVYLMNRPTHELAESIALSGMADVPVKVPSAGSAALRLVAERYNSLVETIASTNQALRQHADRERQRAEAVEDFSDLVLAGVPSGIIAVDEAGRVVRLNAAGRSILSLSEVEVEGQELATLIGAEHPVTRAAHTPVARGEEVVGDRGDPQVLGISSGEVRAPDGTVVGAVVILADLTGLRRLEQQLDLKERLAALGEVAAGLAHEIRNPLGALRGFVELLDRRLEDPARARPLLEKIVREADALAGVVGDFLDFARPAPPRLQPLTVAPLLDEAIEAGRAALGHEDQRIEVSVEPADLTLVADVAQVRRALVNFVLNAGQATGPEGRIDVRARMVDEMVQLSVQDDGPGVPPELLGKLPTPFLTTKPTGTGLGLAVSHQIAQAHGGELICERPAEGGARFVLALPARGSVGAADQGDKT